MLMFHNPLVCECESIARGWKLSPGRTQFTSESRPGAPDSAGKALCWFWFLGVFVCLFVWGVFLPLPSAQGF